MRPYSTLAWVDLEFGICRAEVFLSSSFQSRKKGRRGTPKFGPLKAWCASFINQSRVCLPIHRVPSSPKEAVLLPLSSYSSYRLLGKVY